MTPFTTVEGQAIRLIENNIDTDQLIPARFMSRPRKNGYGDLLFYDLRRDAGGAFRPDFPINQHSGKEPFLIVGENFGCGSSREAAVYVLQDAGFRAIIATSFADIFRNNALKNGLLPVELSKTDYEALCASHDAYPERSMQIKLHEQCVTLGTDSWAFTIAETSRQMLLTGMDEISYTLTHIDKITDFEIRYGAATPWGHGSGLGTSDSVG
jgi:3-isopropylmalate/(R)-2-methylmalate dehydratase small subunit